MSLENVYYDPKHPAGFGSVAKLVKKLKIRKGTWKISCEVKTRTLCTNKFERGSRAILIQ